MPGWGRSRRRALRRLISLLSRSSGLVERILARWVSGNAKWASRSGSASASSSATAANRGRRPSITRSSWSRADRSSGCSNTERIADATMLRALRGTRSWALRVKWTRQRCQADPRSCSRTALTRPAWSSLMTSRTPRRPRSTSPRMNARPGRALVVAGAELEAEHPALAGERDPDRDEGRHRHDPAALAHLEVRRVEPQIRVRGVAQRAGSGTPRPRRRGPRRSG